MDPSHMTEFSSPRYFEKLRSLNEAAAAAAAANATVSTSNPVAQSTTFSLPIHPKPRYGRRRRSDETARSGDAKKRSLGHDLTALRSQNRKPSFSLSISSFRSKLSLGTSTHKSSGAHVEHVEAVFDDDLIQESLSLGELFSEMPSEIQSQIIASLPVPTILNLRLASRFFHRLVSINETTIARYHLAHSVPRYAINLYPAPSPSNLNLHYLCGLWHRLHVSAKLSKLIAEYTTKETFLRNTEAKFQEFQPQHNRMRQRLMPLLFTMYHFFETYRDLHVKHLTANGVPLRAQAYTLNPIERQVMDMYDDRTLLHLHQVFPLILSSYHRRFRPPSYVGTIERSLKGYLKDKPADEVYSTILNVGGLRQAESFWRTRGYNDRRAAIDTWYGFVTTEPFEALSRPKLPKITSFRKKKVPTIVDVAVTESAAGHDIAGCREWFCVKPSCNKVPQHVKPQGDVFNTSMAKGPPMSPLSRDQLSMLLADQQHLSNLWMPTAEAIIMERQIVESPSQIKRNQQILLELIKEDGVAIEEDWAPGLSRRGRTDLDDYLIGADE